MAAVRFAGACILCGAAAAPGGQVEEMSLARMADLAGQVIVGRVSHVRLYWADAPLRIESEVTFSTTEYAKGMHPGATETFTLIVPGGTVGDWTLRISGAPEFAVGEKWMLFLLPAYRTHPVVGVFRGAFRIVADEQGVERVFDADGRGVLDIDARGRVVGTEAEPPGMDLHGHASSHHSPGRRAGEQAALPRQAIEYPEFRSRIQPVLDGSTNHRMSGPAGKRELVTYAPEGLVTPVASDGNRSFELRGAGGAVPRRAHHRAAPPVRKREEAR